MNTEYTHPVGIGKFSFTNKTYAYSRKIIFYPVTQEEYDLWELSPLFIGKFYLYSIVILLVGLGLLRITVPSVIKIIKRN